MTAAACSDAEFIELWRTHKSPAKMADVLGVTKSNIHKRRRNLELKFNIRLDASDIRGKYYANLSPTEHKAAHNLGQLNGQVIVFSDAHFHPGIRTTAFKGLLKLIRELKPRAVIANGDVFDGAQISRFPRAAFLDEGPTVIQELKACQLRMSEIEDAAGKAKLVWPLGNHCLRFEARLAQNVPHFEGVQGFSLKDHFPAWIPCWACWVNDETIVKHRYKGGIHAAHNNTVNSGVNIVTGHLHALKVTPFADYKGTRYGVDTGTLADVYGPQFVNYTELNPMNWRSGFVVLTFHNGRLLMPQIAQKWDDDHMEFAGKLIDVSGE